MMTFDEFLKSAEDAGIVVSEEVLESAYFIYARIESQKEIEKLEALFSDEIRKMRMELWASFKNEEGEIMDYNYILYSYAGMLNPVPVLLTTRRIERVERINEGYPFLWVKPPSRGRSAPERGTKLRRVTLIIFKLIGDGGKDR